MYKYTSLLIVRIKPPTKNLPDDCRATRALEVSTEIVIWHLKSTNWLHDGGGSMTSQRIEQTWSSGGADTDDSCCTEKGVRVCNTVLVVANWMAQCTCDCRVELVGWLLQCQCGANECEYHSPRPTLTKIVKFTCTGWIRLVHITMLRWTTLHLLCGWIGLLHTAV